MPELRASIISRVGELELGHSSVFVDPGPLVISVTGHTSRRIRLDGAERRLSAGGTGVIAMDYTRSTGFHRLDVDGSTFWFATEDHKLRLDGIAEMLLHLRQSGTAWGGQALFSDGSGFLDPHVLYGWFDENADSALDAIETVLTAPRMAEVTVRAVSRRGGSSVLAVPTMRFLRSDPQRNLIEDARGVLVSGNRRYSPSRVIARRRQRTIDTVPNRRAVHFLDLLADLLAELLSTSLSGAARGRCRGWRERVARSSSLPLATQLRLRPNALSAPREGVEFVDPTYGRVFDLTRSVGSFGWSPQVDPSRRYSYVESADRIYQAYVAHRVASALGLAPTSAVLGSDDLAFAGVDFDLYYDRVPPATVLRSWRALTAAPDSSKPDLLLHERSTGKVAVLDAKYRVGSDGHASEDSRKEVAAYQALYGLDSVTILYPGVGMQARVIEDRGMSIVEIPVHGPGDDLAQDMARVLSRMQTPPFR